MLPSGIHRLFSSESPMQLTVVWPPKAERPPTLVDHSRTRGLVVIGDDGSIYRPLYILATGKPSLEHRRSPAAARLLVSDLQRVGAYVPSAWLAPPPATVSVAILVGNSDDKLPQVLWSSLIAKIRHTLQRLTTELHFTGFSEGSEPWQNACFVAELPYVDVHYLKDKLSELCFQYSQASICIFFNAAQFIRPAQYTDLDKRVPESREDLQWQLDVGAWHG